MASVESRNEALEMFKVEIEDYFTDYDRKA